MRSIQDRAKLHSLQARELRLLGRLMDAEALGDRMCAKAIVFKYQSVARARHKLESRLIAEGVIPDRTVGLYV